jgi:hypothetical protein
MSTIEEGKMRGDREKPIVSEKKQWKKRTSESRSNETNTTL